MQIPSDKLSNLKFVCLYILYFHMQIPSQHTSSSMLSLSSMYLLKSTAGVQMLFWLYRLLLVCSKSLCLVMATLYLETEGWGVEEDGFGWPAELCLKISGCIVAHRGSFTKQQCCCWTIVQNPWFDNIFYIYITFLKFSLSSISMHGNYSIGKIMLIVNKKANLTWWHEWKSDVLHIHSLPWPPLPYLLHCYLKRPAIHFWHRLNEENWNSQNKRKWNNRLFAPYLLRLKIICFWLIDLISHHFFKW